MDSSVKVLSLSIQRRAVSAAVFAGLKLDYTQTRQLSSAPSAAEASCLGFINWLLATFCPQLVCLEEPAGEADSRRAKLSALAVKTLRDNGVPIWQATKAELFSAFGAPPLKNRTQLRQVTATIWPVLSAPSCSAFVIDAAALGLLVQTERFIAINQPNS